MIYILDIAGVAVFAISGALVAREKKMDIFGGIVLALVTAVGGGTFRDLVLGMPHVFWVDDPAYVLVAAGAALVTFVVVRFREFPRRTLLIADAFGLALFAVMGAQKALAQEVSGIIAVVLGVLTGVGGGLFRDVLAGEVPLILRKEIYATAAFLGAILYVGLSALMIEEYLAMGLSILPALALRLVAIKWRWALPQYYR